MSQRNNNPIFLVKKLLPSFLQVLKEHYLVLLILVLAFSLAIYQLKDLMMFIGDQGWFYLSARDLALGKAFPLVGITSSHTWLHQGPLWTYMLAIVFKIFGFHPVNGAYLTVFLHLLTIIVLYKTTREMFSKKHAIITSLIYATSPLVIVHARMAYHTSPIPLFVILLLYATWKMIHGNKWYAASILPLLAILYNLELVTVVFGGVLFAIVVHEIWKKAPWIKAVLDRRFGIASIAVTILIMLPIIIHDLSHGFKQTVVFGGWMIFKAIGIFIPMENKVSYHSWNEMATYFHTYIGRLAFEANHTVGLYFVLLAIILCVFRAIQHYREKKTINSYMLVLLFTLLPFLVVTANKTPSEAYLPIFFPTIFIMVSLYLLPPNKKGFWFQAIGVVLTGIVVFTNMGNVIGKNYFVGIQGGYGVPMEYRLSMAHSILYNTNGEPYHLKAEGPGSQFESFTMNYEYLLWWLGHTPVKKSQHWYTISETPIDVTVKGPKLRN